MRAVQAGAFTCALIGALPGAAYAQTTAFYELPDVGFVKSLKPTMPTPRLANGKPDLSGYWSRNDNIAEPDFGMSLFGPVVGAFILGMDIRNIDLSREGADHGTISRARPNKPLYKPEYWDKVQELDFGPANGDPFFRGVVMGLPRQGAPSKIMQSPTEISLYSWFFDAVRYVPTDGRPRDPDDVEESTFAGIGLGHWDGDTLVIESIGFNDKQWLDYPGYLHSDQMTVTERLRREGEYLFYDVTITDPVVLQEPWVMETWVRHLNTNPADRPGEWLPWGTDGANQTTRVRG